MYYDYTDFDYMLKVVGSINVSEWHTTEKSIVWTDRDSKRHVKPKTKAKQELNEFYNRCEKRFNDFCKRCERWA